MSELEGRKITKISVTSPFKFISAAGSRLDGSAETLPFKVGDRFAAADYSHGNGIISEYLRQQLPPGFTMVRVVATTGAIEKCDGDTVEIRYTVFTAFIPRKSGDFLELALAAIQEPATTGGLLGSNGRLQLVPSLNYNHTRQLYGGATVNLKTPLYVFDNLTLDPLVSGNSAVGGGSLNGVASPARKYLNQADWRFGPQYYDVPLPMTSASLKEATLALSAFGSTKELDSRATIHYGASLAGGHVQDGSHYTPNSSYGEFRFMSGVEDHHGQGTLSASYGLQVGTTFSSNAGTFHKQVLDLRYATIFSPLPQYVRTGKDPDDRAKFIGLVHKPLSIDAQFNGGILTGSSQVPAVERFFGGNQPNSPFIVGQTWDVRSQPYIRSIPENGLGIDTPAGVIGGNRFFSTNLTVSKALLGRSLVPTDLANPDFLDHLDGGIKTAKGELSDAYYNKDPGVIEASKATGALQVELKTIKQELGSLPAEIAANPVVKPILKQLNHDVLVATITAAAITSGHGNETPALLEQVSHIEDELKSLADATGAIGDSMTTGKVNAWIAALRVPFTTLQEQWSDSDDDAARKRADAHAAKDLAPATSVLNTILYQLNVYSVAPVGTFDVAQIRPLPGGARYGVGAGVRFSFVNVNFTGGYSFNTTRKLQATPGAAFFSIDFTNLFR